MRLEVEGLRFSYGDSEVLRGVNLGFDRGILSLIGPNGAGKSTLVKCISGALRPSSGTAFFDGRDLLAGRDPDIRMAYMSQEQPRISGMTVLEVMLLGRLEKLSIAVSDEDLDAAYGALELLGIEGLAERDMGELSGGQSQMVLIAQCLVSDPDIVVLDEPMNNLDLCRELEMFEVMSEITRAKDLTTVMILHDINFACRFSDRLAVMRDGVVCGCGRPGEVVTEGMIRDVYGVEAEVSTDAGGRVRVDPVRSIRRR